MSSSIKRPISLSASKWFDSQDGIYRWQGSGRDKAGPTSELGLEGDPEFDAGIERLLRGAAEYTVAIMCAEKDPRNCHRTHLVTPALVARGVTVRHILANGEILEHGDLAAGEGEDDLFRND